MNVEIIDSVKKLSKIEGEWNNLINQCLSPSLYMSYDYNKIACKYLCDDKIKLFIMTIYDGIVLKAIAPFYISRQVIKGIPFRSINFIAAWEGDKPSIIAPFCEEIAWNAIYSYLVEKFRSWDILNIAEQPENNNLFTSSPFLHDNRYFSRITHDSTSYFIDLDSTWDSYMSNIHSKVKRNWRSRKKKIYDLPDEISIDKIIEPENVVEALERFETIEKRSWKGRHPIGLNRDSSTRSFYEEFTYFQADKSLADIFFLKVGEQDIAGAILYKYKDVVYERHIAYDPEYSKLSPGIFLRTCNLQYYFDTGYVKYDMMGMNPNKGVPVAKSDWATGMLKTYRLQVLKKSVKSQPLLLGRTIKRLFNFK